jgi:hypothetical protein
LKGTCTPRVNGALPERFADFGLLLSHDGAVLCIAFSPCGRCLASGSVDRTVRVWDADTGALIYSPFGPLLSPVTAIAFCRGGAALAAGVRDGTVTEFLLSCRAVATTAAAQVCSALPRARRPAFNLPQDPSPPAGSVRAQTIY